MPRLSLLLLLLLSGLPSFAQELSYQLSGQILDDENTPLAGAVVVIENTTVGALTDVEGRFTINSQISAGKLSVRYLGFLEQSVPFDVGQNLQIQLTPIKLEYADLVCCLCYSYSAPDKSKTVWPVAYAQNSSRLRNSLNTYSEQAVLNGQLSGLIVPQAENPQTYFQSAYYGQASQSMSHGLPLHPNSQMANALLWELGNQEIELLDPLDGLTKSGLSGINGALNYQSNQYSIKQGLQYRNALGTNLQEHHLAYGVSHKLGKTRITAHRVKGASLPEGQMTGASIANSINHKNTSLFSELQVGQVSWGDSFGERQTEQLALLHNQFSQSFNQGPILQLSHDTQWFKNSNTLEIDAQHNLRLEGDYYLDMLRLELKAGGEHFQSDYLRNTAYYGQAKFNSFGLFEISAHARQEHINTPSSQELQASSYGGEISINVNDIACVPSRFNLSIASSRLHLSQNAAWLNHFNLDIPIRAHQITAQLSYNRYSAREDIDLGWIHWQQLGQQKSLGASLQIVGNQQLQEGQSSLRYWAKYSYNQSQFNPFSMPIQGRRSYVSGQTLAFQMPQILPKSLLALGQEMNWKEWRFAFNLWAWLQNSESQVANGLNLQEVQLSWGHQFASKSKWDQCRLYLHGQNLLSFSEANPFAQLPLQAARPTLPQNPTLLVGMEISLF